MSAIKSTTVSTAKTAKTPIVMGVRTFTSMPVGRGRPRSRAKKARISSAIATAICPPSRGNIGSKLKSPTKILRLATISRKVPSCSVLSSLVLLTTSPDTRAAPTTPTKPLGSRLFPAKSLANKLWHLCRKCEERFNRFAKENSCCLHGLRN